MQLSLPTRALTLTVLFALFACLVHTQSLTKREVEELPAIVPEEGCLAAGGHCIHTSKCPADKVSKEAECAKQKLLGAVCCHSAHPTDESRCEMLTGECKEECSQDLTITQAKDCPQDKICCALV